MTTPAFPPLPNPIQPAPAGPPRIQPFHLRQRQGWAIEQQRKHHAEALYAVGEWAVFFLLWHVIDHENGLVARCTRCQPTSSVDARIGAVYQQPTQNECPVCFGTLFEGGYRARIVRPAIFADTDEDEKVDRRGTVRPDTVSVESTWDFRIRTGDFVVRADNSRWRLSVPNRTTLRSGFGFPGQQEAAITYGRMTAALEERNTVAYRLPPTTAPEVENTLRQPMVFPADFSTFEDIRGPLVSDIYLTDE